MTSHRERGSIASRLSQLDGWSPERAYLRTPASFTVPVDVWSLDRSGESRSRSAVLAMDAADADWPAPPEFVGDSAGVSRHRGDRSVSRRRASSVAEDGVAEPATRERRPSPTQECRQRGTADPDGWSHGSPGFVASGRRQCEVTDRLRGRPSPVRRDRTPLQHRRRRSPTVRWSPERNCCASF